MSSADVERDARMPRFDGDRLERLLRRHSRIAAVVNRTLARLLAERVMNATRALR